MHHISDITARMRHVHLPRGNETIARHLAESAQDLDPCVERHGSALLIRQLWFAAWNYWTRTVKGISCAARAAFLG